MKNELNLISTVRQKRHDLSRFVAVDVLTFAGLMPYAYYTHLKPGAACKLTARALLADKAAGHLAAYQLLYNITLIAEFSFNPIPTDTAQRCALSVFFLVDLCQL